MLGTKHRCIKSDRYHTIGHEYTLGDDHDMPGWVFVRETGQHAERVIFEPVKSAMDMAGDENERLSKRLNFDK